MIQQTHFQTYIWWKTVIWKNMHLSIHNNIINNSQDLEGA